jgi:hypothetical protein
MKPELHNMLSGLVISMARDYYLGLQAKFITLQYQMIVHLKMHHILGFVK